MHRLRGMFAFAHAGTAGRGELFCARDRSASSRCSGRSGSGRSRSPRRSARCSKSPVSRARDRSGAGLPLSLSRPDRRGRAHHVRRRPQLPAGSFARVALERRRSRRCAIWTPTMRPARDRGSAAADELRETFLEVGRACTCAATCRSALRCRAASDSSAILTARATSAGREPILRTFSFTATGSECRRNALYRGGRAGGRRAKPHGADRAGRDRRRHRPAGGSAGRAVRQPLDVRPASRDGIGAPARRQGDTRRPGRRRAVRGLSPLSGSPANRAAGVVPGNRSDTLHARHGVAAGREPGADRTGAGTCGAPRLRGLASAR